MTTRSSHHFISANLLVILAVFSKKRVELQNVRSLS